MLIGADLSRTSRCKIKGYSETLREYEAELLRGQGNALTKSMTVLLGCMIASTIGRVAWYS